MKTNSITVARARTALRIGLEQLDIKQGETILLPDYYCDVLLHPLKALGLKTITYKVLDNLSPDWNYLNRIDTKNIFGIIMIHYFGQPQDIIKFQKFCSSKNIYLIEDNAHGFGGTYNGKALGTFGDIGISSPRKILGLPNGGILYLKKDYQDIDLKSSLKKSSFSQILINYIKFFIYKQKPIYKKLSLIKQRQYNFSDPYAFKEKEKDDYSISNIERRAIAKSKLNQISDKRQKLWYEWKNYLSSKGLKPVFNELDLGACPWVIAFYSDSISERNKWIRWGHKRNLTVFSWPSLSDEAIKEKGVPYKRWERTVCVGLDDPPPKHG